MQGTYIGCVLAFLLLYATPASKSHPASRHRRWIGRRTFHDDGNATSIRLIMNPKGDGSLDMGRMTRGKLLPHLDPKKKDGHEMKKNLEGKKLSPVQAHFIKRVINKMNPINKTTGKISNRVSTATVALLKLLNTGRTYSNAPIKASLKVENFTKSLANGLNKVIEEYSENNGTTEGHSQEQEEINERKKLDEKQQEKDGKEDDVGRKEKKDEDEEDMRSIHLGEKDALIYQAILEAFKEVENDVLQAGRRRRRRRSIRERKKYHEMYNKLPLWQQNTLLHMAEKLADKKRRMEEHSEDNIISKDKFNNNEKANIFENFSLDRNHKLNRFPSDKLNSDINSKNVKEFSLDDEKEPEVEQNRFAKYGKVAISLKVGKKEKGKTMKKLKNKVDIKSDLKKWMKANLRPEIKVLRKAYSTKQRMKIKNKLRGVAKRFMSGKRFHKVNKPKMSKKKKVRRIVLRYRKGVKNENRMKAIKKQRNKLMKFRKARMLQVKKQNLLKKSKKLLEEEKKLKQQLRDLDDGGSKKQDENMLKLKIKRQKLMENLKNLQMEESKYKTQLKSLNKAKNFNRRSKKVGKVKKLKKPMQKPEDLEAKKLRLKKELEKLERQEAKLNNKSDEKSNEKAKAKKLTSGDDISQAFAAKFKEIKNTVDPVLTSISKSENKLTTPKQMKEEKSSLEEKNLGKFPFNEKTIDKFPSEDEEAEKEIKKESQNKIDDKNQKSDDKKDQINATEEINGEENLTDIIDEEDEDDADKDGMTKPSQEASRRHKSNLFLNEDGEDDDNTDEEMDETEMRKEVDEELVESWTAAPQILLPSTSTANPTTFKMQFPKIINKSDSSKKKRSIKGGKLNLKSDDPYLLELEPFK